MKPTIRKVYGMWELTWVSPDGALERRRLHWWFHAVNLLAFLYEMGDVR